MAAASDIVAGARRFLQDYDADRYSDADLLKYANSARRAFAMAQPGAYAVSSLFTLAAGVRQTLPTDLAKFYDISSTSAGAPVTVTEREYLDAFRPGWRNQTAGPTVHFMYDERDKFAVEVFPPAVASAQVRLSYSRVPSDLALGGTLNQAEDMALDALVDYTTGRVLLEDATSPENRSRAVLHLQAFASAVGADVSATLALSPNSANNGGKPPRIATGGAQ